MNNFEEKKKKIRFLSQGLDLEFPEFEKNYIGKTIKYFREQTHELTQDEVAMLCNLSQPLINAREQGKSYPSVEQILTFCYYLRIQPNNFWSKLVGNSGMQVDLL